MVIKRGTIPFVTDDDGRILGYEDELGLRGDLLAKNIGTAVLVAGEGVVADTRVRADSVILLTSQADGGTPGFVRVSPRTAGQDFTITSSNALDTSTVGYLILNPLA